MSKAIPCTRAPTAATTELLAPTPCKGPPHNCGGLKHYAFAPFRTNNINTIKNAKAEIAIIGYVT